VFEHQISLTIDGLALVMGFILMFEQFAIDLLPKGEQSRLSLNGQIIVFFLWVFEIV